MRGRYIGNVFFFIQIRYDTYYKSKKNYIGRKVFTYNNWKNIVTNSLLRFAMNFRWQLVDKWQMLDFFGYNLGIEIGKTNKHGLFPLKQVDNLSSKFSSKILQIFFYINIALGRVHFYTASNCAEIKRKKSFFHSFLQN